MRRSVAVITAAALAGAATIPAVALASRGHGPKPARYYVGGAVKSINPTQAMIDARDFYLGGYGFASGRIGNQVEIPGASDALGNRYATGVLGDRSFNRFPSEDGTFESDGVHSRAFAVSDGKHAVVLSQIETQGYFDAYKQGPFGLNEIRQDAASQIAALAAAAPASRKKSDPLPAPTASEIVVDSNHSHGGPDTAGVWGGVPTSYLKLVHDRTVAAIVDAWKAMRPATLSYGVAKAGVNGEAQYPPEEGAADPTADWLLNNQFSEDPANQVMDNEVRVFQARDAETGDVIDTYVNFSAHPTVLGGGNTKATGDYVGRLNVLIEKEFGGFGMDQVATLGRTQPNRDGCTDPTLQGDAQSLCAIDGYAARVMRKVKAAVANAKPFTGAPQVAMNSYFLSDTTTSAVLAGIVYAGEVIGAPAARAANAPWYTGSQLGTSLFTGRIGDVLVTGGPGEMYPQIFQKVRDTVKSDAGIRGFMNIGTAGDFLGYIIAPLEAYPCPAAASFVDGGCNQDTDPDPTRLFPSPIGNDNYFFNISHTFGERLTCDFLRGAGDILANDAQRYWSTYDRCAAFVNDEILPPGQDMTFPQQPDLSSVPAFQHM